MIAASDIPPAQGDRMPIINGTTRFGLVSKFFHWTVFLLFVNQYVTGVLMMRLHGNDTAFGYVQGDYYTWHKSVGLVVIALVLLRITWRKTTRLPDWPDTLADWEQTAMKWTERVLYLCMFVMPVSGYVFTLAGGYNFKLFGMVPLPQLIPKDPSVARIAEFIHAGTAFVIIAAVALHVALAIKRHRVDRDGFLHRMLPFR
jgi:cytochrome b561